MMIATLLVVGAFSYFSLPIELFPPVDFPFVVVTTVYQGAAAESVETEVTKKIEDVINEISGVRHITSKSQEGYSLIFVEFELSKDGAVAAQDVTQKVASIRGTLPDNIEEPITQQYDPESQPVMSLVVSGKRPLRDVTELAKNKIKTRLEIISGVGSVQLVGGFEREIQLAINPQQMESYGVAVSDVQQAVAAANLDIPSGRIDETSIEYLVRVMGRLALVRDFNDIIVKRNNGTPVHLSDFAVVADTIKEQRSLSRYNGHTAVALNLIKQSGANVVEMATKARETVEQLRTELPPDVKIDIVDDNSTFIRDSVHEIIFNIEFGTLLAVLVVFLFLLDYKPTIITGLSIPISIIATFGMMKFLGFSINVMTLLGLSLAVGILIDDAIVVVENVYRHLSMGKSPIRAALDGTNEIGMAVAATTFSIMVVFLPVAFMSGIIGRFFYQFGMTVAFAVLVSLFVAFTLTPMLSSRMLRKSQIHGLGESGQAPKPSGGLWGGIKKLFGYWNVAFDALMPKYKSTLAFSLRHRWLVMLVATITFAVSIFMVTKLGQEFMTRTDQGKFYVSVTTPPGTTLDETSARIADVETAIMSMKEVTGSFVTIGSGNNPVTDGIALFLLEPVEERDLSAQELADSARVLVSKLAGMKIAVALEPSEGGGKPVEISIRGENRTELALLAHQVQRITYSIPGAADIDNTLLEGKPEIQVTVDRQLADDLGLSLMTIPQTVRSLIEGDVITQFKDGEEEYDVRMKLQKQFRNSGDDIGRIIVKSTKEDPSGVKLLVPLNRVAKFERRTSVSEFNRFDRQNEARVNANVLTGSYGGTVVNEIMTRVNEEIKPPPGYMIAPTGTNEIMTESFVNILKALLLSIVFIYVVLSSLYESFWDPFSIMLSLPMSLIGAILVLWMTGSALSIMSMIGIVMLMGLVTKNAILLIDFVKQQRESGVGRFDAILEAGPIRLRPILMTTFATVFGMLPLALGLGPGAELRAPMARAVIGGMISSTVLTLVVVPVVYTLIDDFVGFFRRKKRQDNPPEVTEGNA